MSKYDVIIIGAGHNGLTAAGYLARSGRRVLILESRHIAGGTCVTEEAWPGYRVSSAAYLCSLLHPRIVSDLELPRFGYDIYRRECGGFSPFEDGSHLQLFPDSFKTRMALKAFAPRDIDAYFDFERDVERAADVLEPFFFSTSPSMGQLADAFAEAGVPDLFEQFFTRSVRELLEPRFHDDRLKAILSTDGLIGTAAGPSDSGTAYVLLHHYMGKALGERGLWGYVRGGMGGITQAMLASAKLYGARIETGDRVVRILTSDDSVKSVITESGVEYEANYVLSNAHPVTTYSLVHEPCADGPRAKAAQLRSEGVSCKINLGVTELPNFTCKPGKRVGPQHLGTVHLCSSMDELDQSWQEARTGYPSKRPMIEIYIQTATDNSLVPEGRHILSCFTQYYPYRLAPGIDNDTAANLYCARVIDAVSKVAPNVPQSILHKEVLTPKRLEERFGLVGGHIFHGDITPDQMFGGRGGNNGPATPIRGLYICGSGAFPGGCVSGLPGYNAAQLLMKRPREASRT